MSEQTDWSEYHLSMKHNQHKLFAALTDKRFDEAAVLCVQIEAAAQHIVEFCEAQEE